MTTFETQGQEQISRQGQGPSQGFRQGFQGSSPSSFFPSKPSSSSNAPSGGGRGGGAGRNISPLGDVTNKQNIGGGLTTIEPKLLPKQSIVYSDWVLAQTENYLPAENPLQGAKHWKQNKEIYWSTFADWAAKNPVQMKQTFYLYMQDENNWIFQFFPIKISKASTFIQEVLSVNQEMSLIGVRKVPFRNISSSVISRTKHAIYTAQGFQMDYHFMKTPGGMEAWDRMVDAITANLWSFVIYQSMNELLFEPSYYRKENKLYPYSEVPYSAEKLFNLEQNSLFIINKEPQAFHKLIANSSRVFEQGKVDVKGLILPRSLLWYSHARDPTNIFYDKSGPISLRERVSAGEEKTVDGLTMYPIPLSSGKLHDGTFSSMLDFPIQLGGFTLFKELTQHLSPEEYSSEKRSIRFASCQNQMKKYTLIETLRHVPEFYPIDYRRTQLNDNEDDDNDDRENGAPDSYEDDVIYHNDGSDRMFDNPSNPAGQINRGLLWMLIKNREMVFQDRLRTKLKGNEEYLNTLIRYIKAQPNAKPDDQADGDKFYPIDMFGEIADCNARTKYLTHVYRTMEHQLFEDLGAEGIAKFEKGMKLAKILNAPNVETSSSSTNRPVASTINAMLGSTVSSQINARYQGLPSLQANEYGGPSFDGNLARVFQSSGTNKSDRRPWGMGNIAGFLTLADMYQNNADVFNEDDMKIIYEFVDVYKVLVGKLIKLCPSNACLSPRLLPSFNWNNKMTEFNKIMIVAWNTLFSNMVSPNIINVTLNDRTTVKTVLTQFTFEKEIVGLIGHALLQIDEDSTASLVPRNNMDGNLYTKTALDTLPFENTDDKMFGGTLFTALPFVDPSLPLLERSGDIHESLTKRQDVSIFPSNHARTKYLFRPVALNHDQQKAYLKNEKAEYTEDYYNYLASQETLKDYPASITHMIANPIVKHKYKTVSDFEARIIASHTSYTKTLGLAARAVLFSRINLQTLTAWFDNNIAIPFGAMCIRPFETQITTSAIAVANGPIGTTFFSGFDNHVAFDTGFQHYTVQAFCQTAPVVTNNKKYLILPAVQGGPFLGGKGHLFVNQNSHMLIQDMERVKNAIETLNGIALGDHSIIATLTSYNSAVEKQEYQHMDIRNNYRRENFVGRMTIAPQDFVDERPKLTYSAAPILNALFDWNHPVTASMMTDLSFAQYMYNRSNNYHIHQTLYEEWDVIKGSGWVKTKSYHPWGDTEQDNCENVQTSHASVVKANK